MKKVLVVDDDQDILTLVEITLSMNNFEVQAISRWEEIKDKIKSFQPDLILLDVALIGADGREICKQIKQPTKQKYSCYPVFSACRCC
jgi:DNA-binding response OmpR family regulator